MSAKELKITIGGQHHTIIPFYGLPAIRMMPKLLSVLSTIMGAAIRAGIPFDKWLLQEEAEMPTLLDAITALEFISDALGEKFDMFEKDLVPFILQLDHKWLESHGTPREIAVALWQALKFHLETSLGEDVMSSLKNWMSAEEVADRTEAKQTETAQETHLTTSEPSQ